MLINITNISDSINHDDTSSAKLILMDDIIYKFMPLFSEEIDEKKQQLGKNKEDYLKLKEAVNNSKKILATLEFKVKREQIVASILKGIEQLSNQDLLYGRNRTLVVDIFEDLKTTQDLKVLRSYLAEITKLNERNKKKIIT